jgi:hypothetical protein
VEKWRGSSSPVLLPDRRSFFPPPEGALIRAEVARSLIAHRYNLAARRVDFEEAKWPRGCATYAASGRRSSQ